MKLVGKTKLSHGIVMHYSTNNGNVESCFYPDDDFSNVFFCMLYYLKLK